MYLQIPKATPTLNAKVTLVKGGSEDEISSDQIGRLPAPAGGQDRMIDCEVQTHGGLHMIESYKGEAPEVTKLDSDQRVTHNNPGGRVHRKALGKRQPNHARIWGQEGLP